MAAPTIIQHDSYSAAGAYPITKTLVGVTAGSTIVVVEHADNLRPLRVTDDKNNDWLVATCGISDGNYICVQTDCAAGDTEITLKAQFSQGSLDLDIFELSPCQISEHSQFQRYSNGVQQASNGIDIPADSIAFGTIRANASTGTVTPGAGWTEFAKGGSLAYHGQYKAFSALSVAETGAITTTINRNSWGMLIALRDLSGGGGGTTLIVIED